MSKADPGSGTLEDILSSIRKSLAEQSTDMLTEASAASSAAEINPTGRREGLVGRLANATAGIADRPAAQEDDLSDVLEATEGSPAPAASPAAVAATATREAAAETAAAEKDPLWFLTRKEPEPASVSGTADTPPLTQPEILRAALPPFFGASSQGSKVETAPTLSGGSTASPLSGTGVQAGSRASVEREIGRILDPAMAREVSLVAAAAETAGRPAGPGVATGRQGTAGGEVPHALESMVLELLKPMMRQWLDQNMPRLVAAALKEEADRAAGDGSTGKP